MGFHQIGAARFSPAFFVIFTSAAATAASDAKSLAEELVTLRSEVEALSDELESRRAEEKQRVTSSAQRKAELEADARREELRIRRVDAALEEQRAASAKASDEEKELAPAVGAALGELEAHIRTGLPFQVEERLAAVATIKTGLTAGELTPAKAALRLWALHQDEARLTKENGLYRQTIALDGQKVLAEVARVGMVFLFFRTPDGGYGRAERSGEGWVYRRFNDENDTLQTAALFDAFKKQIRTGWFELPVSLASLHSPSSTGNTPAQVLP
ncbi:MAG: DUF3450 family protein [Myxococcota bacterium]